MTSSSRTFQNNHFLRESNLWPGAEPQPRSICRQLGYPCRPSEFGMGKSDPSGNILLERRHFTLSLWPLILQREGGASILILCSLLSNSYNLVPNFKCSEMFLNTYCASPSICTLYITTCRLRVQSGPFKETLYRNCTYMLCRCPEATKYNISCSKTLEAIRNDPPLTVVLGE